MERIIENTNLDINLWLTNWGLMSGEYKDGIFKITKFGLINQLFITILLIFELIKWVIFIFTSADSRISHYFGEFTTSLGPKLILDTMIIWESINSLILIYYFGSKFNGKSLFWLEFMHFDVDKRCFDNLDLNEIDSKKFIKQFALAYFLIKQSNYLLSLITFSFMIISFFVFINKYHFYYINSITIFSIGVWYKTYHWFGLLMVFYQVMNLVNL